METAKPAYTIITRDLNILHSPTGLIYVIYSRLNCHMHIQHG